MRVRLLCLTSLLVLSAVSLSSKAQDTSQDAVAGPPLPVHMRFCGVSNCYTLDRQGDGYDATNEAVPNYHGPKTRFTVESFSIDSVILHRQEPNGNQAIVTGRMAGDREHLEPCEMRWRGSSGVPLACRVTWKNSLNSSPAASTPEATPVDQSLKGCNIDPQAMTASGQSAYEKAIDRLRVKDFANAYCWFTISANSGYWKGLVAYGWALDNGVGVQEDAKRSFAAFLKAAADRDALTAQFFVVRDYVTGHGTDRNLQEAKRWADRLKQTPVGEYMLKDAGYEDGATTFDWKAAGPLLDLPRTDYAEQDRAAEAEFQKELASKHLTHAIYVSEAEMRNRCTTMVSPGPSAIAFNGRAMVRVLISKTGTVTPLDLDLGNPLTRNLAMEAVKKWEFKPYQLHGQPVDVESTITVVFDPEIPAGQVTHPQGPN